MASPSFLVVLLVALAAAPASASAASRISVAPVAVRGTVATFPVAAPAGAVRSPRVVVGRRIEPLPVARLEAAARRGVLRYRTSRTGARRLVRARLRYVVEAPRETCTFGSFGAATRPGACWRPYGDASPFNTRIPAGTGAVAGSQRRIAAMTAWGPPQGLPAGVADTDMDYGHPVYFARPSDPVYRIRCDGPYDCPIDGRTVHLPAGARPAGGDDGHLTVVEQHTGWEYDLWQARVPSPVGGVLEATMGGRTRIDGDGLGSDATASRFGGLAGIVRSEELRAGRIDHALFLTVPCDSGDWVYPADKSGRSCDRIGRGTRDALPMGARLQLRMSATEIDALRVPAWNKAILRAMAEYGMYLGDTGGKSWAIQLESSSSFTALGRPDPLLGLARDSGLTAWGGIAYLHVAGVDWASRLRVVPPPARH